MGVGGIFPGEGQLWRNFISPTPKLRQKHAFIKNFIAKNHISRALASFKAFSTSMCSID